MIFERVNLKDYYALDFDTVLEVISPETVDFNIRDLAKTVLVLPGGGYAFISNREKDPVALAFLKKGFVAATLTYTVNSESNPLEKLFPIPYLQVACALDYLRKNFDRLRINPDQIGLVGFSAGAHLAGSYSYLYKEKDLFEHLGVKQTNLKPNFLVLGYPVVSLISNFHNGSMLKLTNGDQNLNHLLSIEEHITDDYPPTFVWNTLEDIVVNPINTNIIADKLKQSNVSFKMLQFPHGWHGLSLVDENTVLDYRERQKYQDVATWFDACVDFINSIN